MKSFGKLAAMPLLAFALAACAPEGNKTEAVQADEASKASEAPVITSEGPAENLPAVPGKQVALLEKVVNIPFEFKQVYDRVREGTSGVKERQIGLTTSLADHKAVAGQLEDALKQAGFVTKTSENKDGWVWITVIADAGQSKIAVRPEKNKPGTVIVFKVPEA